MFMREPANIRLIIVAACPRLTTLLHQNKEDEKQEDGSKGKSQSPR
jgi:hypothetical protein